MNRNEKWYQEGLCFECVECGNCCTGAPGYVWVRKDEIALIARLLGRSDGTLEPDQVRRVALRYSLTERPNGDCVFLQNMPDGKRRCEIYPVRPFQCRTWPFWPDNLHSQKKWNEAARHCPGMNRGKHYSWQEIEQTRRTKN